jgi:hypothetical protein
MNAFLQLLMLHGFHDALNTLLTTIDAADQLRIEQTVPGQPSPEVAHFSRALNIDGHTLNINAEVGLPVLRAANHVHDNAPSFATLALAVISAVEGGPFTQTYTAAIGTSSQHPVTDLANPSEALAGDVVDVNGVSMVNAITAVTMSLKLQVV